MAKAKSRPRLGLGRLWRGVRRRAREAIVEPAPGPVATESASLATAPSDPRPPLLRMSPFSIGFTGTLGALVALALAAALTTLRDILLVIVVALFLALGLNPIVEWITRRGLRRSIAVVLVLLGVGGLIALGSWALIPLVIEQGSNLIDDLPASLQQIRQNEQIAAWDAEYGFIDTITRIVTDENFWGRIFGGFVGAAMTLAAAFASFLIATVLTMYFLASLPTIKEVIYRLAPASKRPRTRYLANEMFRRIGGYLTGMFVVVSCSATASFVMMQFVGLGRFALALAFVVGLFAFIPLVGTSTAMVIVALVALSVSWQSAVIVIIYFLLYQQFEAYIIQPRVMAHSVKVPGVLVVVAALAGGILAGVVGALVAIPTAAALLLLFREVLMPSLDRG